MKKLSYSIALISIVISATYSVRVGAITLAIALALFEFPSFRNRRLFERIFLIALVLSLITVALALPRR